jgi:uncharacterized protein YceH (UPF0502 family)
MSAERSGSLSELLASLEAPPSDRPQWRKDFHRLLEALCDEARARGAVLERLDMATRTIGELECKVEQLESELATLRNRHVRS